MDTYGYGRVNVQVPIGKPLLQCSPLANVVTVNYKGTICDSCLTNLVDKFSIVPCPKCSRQFYCSQECLQKDLLIHETECRTALYEKIETAFSSEKFKSKLPDLFLSPDDIIDYTQLFFRILKVVSASKSHEDSMEVDGYENVASTCSSTVSIGNRKRTISWLDIHCPLQLSEELMEDENEELITDYLEDYDDLTESKRKELDAKLGFTIPDDDYFRELILKSEVTAVVNSAVDTVVEQLEPMPVDKFNAYVAPNGEYVAVDDSYHTRPSSGLSYSSEEDELEEEVPPEEARRETSFLSSLANERIVDLLLSQNEDFLKTLAALPFDKRRQFIVNCVNTVQSEGESVGAPQQSKGDTLSGTFRMPAPRPEATPLDSIKLMFRLIQLDALSMEYAKRDRKPFDDKLGFWIIPIKEILQMDGVKGHFGPYDWNEIVKVFYVTLRYCIAIPDVVYNCPISRGVFLPMTQISHSCIPNTTAVFDGSTLRLFYLPSNQIQVRPAETFFSKTTYDDSIGAIFDPKLTEQSAVASILPYLPLTKQTTMAQLSFDFHFELFGHYDSESVFSLNNVRLIDCTCERCCDFRLDNDDEAEKTEKAWWAMDDEEEDYLGCQQQEAPKGSKVDLYAKCLTIVRQLNAQYGNFLDHEFAPKVELPAKRLLGYYRKFFGYYHPRVSVLLLLLAHSSLIIIKNMKEPKGYLLFYRYLLLHSYLIEAIDAIAITHGHEHRYIADVLKTAHIEVHKKLAKFYSESKEIIDKCEKEGSSGWSVELFSQIDNCGKVKNLNSRVAELEDNKLIEDNGVVIAVNSNRTDDSDTEPTSMYASVTAYNPFKRARYYSDDGAFDYDEEDWEEKDDEPAKSDGLAPDHLNDLTLLLERFSQICDFYEFRKL